MDWVASQRLFFGVRGGYYMADQHDTNVTVQPLYRFGNTSNVGFLDVPSPLQKPAGFTSIPTNTQVVRDQQTRASVQADGTWYAKAGGDHQFKFGVQLDRVGNDVLSGESRPRVSVNWNTALGGVRGPYGYYTVRSNGADPTKGFITEGNIHTTNIGLFIQDAWTIGRKLTVNAGLRTERERVPTYTTGADIPEFGIEFPFKDKLAPRAGFAYDINGDGKWKAFGSWGVFYDIFKLELPRGSFGGDKWLDYNYTLDTFDWPNLLANSACPPACPGTLISGPIDFRHPSFGSDSIQPGLKPMRQQEATVGLDHQLGNVVAVGVHYVHKQIDRAIEDTGSLDAAGNEIYIIANPGEGLTALASTDPVTALPKAKRDYDSVEFSVEKRFSARWYLRSSYLWSRLYGNYSGLSQSDENGRTSPNVGRAFDYPVMMFQDGGVPAYGPLATDRPNQFKTQFIYQLPIGTSVGANYYLASGLPVSREIGIYPTSNLPVNYLGRGSDGRTAVYAQTDLFVQHSFRFAGSRQFQIGFNVLNLFNQKAAGQQVQHVSARQRRRPERGALLSWPADAGAADRRRRTSRRIRASSRTTCISRRSRRASDSSSPSRPAEESSVIVRPVGFGPRGFFSPPRRTTMRIRLACLMALIGVSAHLLSAQPQRNQNRGRAMGPYRIGLEEMRSEQWEKASADFRNAIEIDPTFEMAYYALGRSLMPQKKYAEAVTRAREVPRPLYRTGGTAVLEPAGCAAIPARAADRARRSHPPVPAGPADGTDLRVDQAAHRKPPPAAGKSAARDEHLDRDVGALVRIDGSRQRLFPARKPRRRGTGIQGHHRGGPEDWRGLQQPRGGLSADGKVR